MHPQPSVSASESETATPSPSPTDGLHATSSSTTPTSSSATSPAAASKSAPQDTPATPPRAARIPIAQIQILDPTNARVELNDSRIADLRASIAATGLIHPITVRATPTGYTLIAGRHRLEAMRQLNATFIDATVLNVDDLTAHTIRLTENVTRTNLSPIEEACQLNTLVETHPAGVDGVAAITGRSPSWIQDRLEILSWPVSLRTHVHHKKISLTAARRLARIQPDNLREQRIHQAAAHGINARTASLWLQDTLSTPPNPNELSEKSTNLSTPEYITETRVHCFTCATPTKLDETKSVRLCPDCIIAITNAMNKQPPHESPQTPLP